MDVDAAFDVASRHCNGWTSAELRYVQDNWDGLSSKVTFIMHDEPIPAPWVLGQP